MVKDQVHRVTRKAWEKTEVWEVSPYVKARPIESSRCAMTPLSKLLHMLNHMSTCGTMWQATCHHVAAPGLARTSCYTTESWIYLWKGEARLNILHPKTFSNTHTILPCLCHEPQSSDGLSLTIRYSVKVLLKRH